MSALATGVGGWGGRGLRGRGGPWGCAGLARRGGRAPPGGEEGGGGGADVAEPAGDEDGSSVSGHYGSNSSEAFDSIRKTLHQINKQSGLGIRLGSPLLPVFQRAHIRAKVDRK